MELICPAGTPAALKSAIDARADAVYCGFNDETNARNFPGLNFSRDELRQGIALAGGPSIPFRALRLSSCGSGPWTMR